MGLNFTPKIVNKTVSSAGTRVQLFSSETPCHSFTIQANSGNTGVIYLGDVTVSSTVYGAAITKGTSFSASCDGNDSKLDLSLWYIDAGTSNDAVSITYF